jgi:hypothetical protein
MMTAAAMRRSAACTLGFLGMALAACGSASATGGSGSTVHPPPRSSAAMAFDPLGHSILLYGGVDVAQVTEASRYDTWSWSGSWKRYDGFSPKVADPALAYDRAHHQMILVGLTSAVFDDDAARFAESVETWVWDGRAWANPHPVALPHRSLDPPALAYDAIAGEMILVEREPDVGETMWRWTGSGWAPIRLATGGTPGSAPAHHRLLITAPDGRVSTTEGELEEWDGQAWRASGLVLPGGAIAAVDERTHSWVAYAFGLRGLDDSATLIASGPGPIRRVNSAHAPPARSEASIAFDPMTGAVVLFGGHAPLVQGGLADTWVWSASDWSRG